MKKFCPALLLFFSLLHAGCQSIGSELLMNGGFEIVENGVPVGWKNFGSPNYSTGIDSTVVRSGRYSAIISYTDGNPDFKAFGYTLPHNFKGKKITLSGYIKTENVTDGYAGLWMRIDPSVAFDNMSNRGVKGTNDWTKYEVTLKMNPERTKQIVIGGLLVGKGKMWIDEIQVQVDGKDIRQLKPFIRETLPAEQDTEFDNGSGITKISLEKNQIENLKTLGLIWGFLKYYHPNIAAGKYNWDYALFRILPSVLQSDNNEKRDSILSQWIKGLGNITKETSSKRQADEVKIYPDTEWITHYGFSDELTTLLTTIKHAQRSENHYYIGLNSRVGNPEFKNELPYTSMKYTDAGFRLLALYRYWNIIQYYFPYKNLIGEDWKNVLEEFIPKFINAENDVAYTLAVLELIGRVHDTHANVWGGNPVLNNYFGMNYAPVAITFIDNRPVVSGYYHEKYGQKTGLLKGDIIHTINGKPVDEVVKEMLPYTPASNYPTQLRDIARNLLRTNDTIIRIEYIRNFQTKNSTLHTFPSSELNLYYAYQDKDTCFKMIGSNIAYINNGSLKRNYMRTIWKNIKNTKGLIIDNRNYPSDFPIYTLCRYIQPKAQPFVWFTQGSLLEPGLFTFKKTLSAGKRNKGGYNGKVVILVNELTQSSAEFHAMAYRIHPNAIVIGSTTAAADGNVSQIVLPGNILTMISGIGVYYPDGRETQRIGIVPDIVCTPTIKGLTEGRDELLEKAIEFIQTE